jgi:histidinol-phosphatase
MVSGVELRDYLDFAVQTACEAGRLTLGYFRTGTMRPELKPDSSPVTAADKEAEKLIRSRIAANYPGHAVIGEEYGVEGEASHRWIVDPIDGRRPSSGACRCTGS